MRNLTPIILSLIFVSAIIVLSFIRLMHGPNLWSGYGFNVDVVFISFYLLWVVVELPVAKNEIHQGKKTSDFGTCELYAISQGFTFLSALWFHSFWKVPTVAHFLGLAIFLAGIGYRLWAIKTLGRYYSHVVREVDEHKIIDSGPYRFIRHPAYAGMIVANMGVTVYFFNWVTLAIFLFGLVPSIILRILVEEKTLFQMVGYREFAAKRKRLFPALW